MTDNTSSPTLTVRLRQANSKELLALVQEHGRTFGIREVRQTLLNPFVSSVILEELLALRQLSTVYEIRVALCRHRRTPEVGAIRLVPGLRWRELMEVASDLRLSPALRRVAEKYLVQRMPRLSVGEKITLARRASPEVMVALRQDPSLGVVRALLENSRLTEALLQPLVASDRTRPQILKLVADHLRWGRLYGVRKALATNPLTPFGILFEILPNLLRPDLEAVSNQESHSSVVRQRALEILESGGAKEPPEEPELHLLPIDPSHSYK